MKAGLALALVARREAAGYGLAGDVLVVVVADEEHAGTGVREVPERFTPTRRSLAGS